MGRLRSLLLICALASSFAAALSAETVTGTLTTHEGGPAIETAGHKFIALDGDASTRGVINDHRLAGMQIEAKGHFTAPGSFLIDPIHTRAILVRRDGHLKLVTYWCDICSLRSYTPGPCWCCQRETTLDLRDRDEP